MNATVAPKAPTALDSVGGRWVDRIAQVGLVARGVVYALVGVLALQLALGERREPEDSRGALAELADRSFGGVLLLAVGIGLAAYALACALGAIRGHGGKKGGASDTGDRFRDAWRAVVNGALAVFAFGVLTGRKSKSESSGSDTEQHLTAKVLDWPGGQLLVGAVGLGFAGFGIWQARKAVTRSFVKGLDLHEASPGARRWVERLGTAGYLARGIVYLVIGWFLVDAALDHQPEDTVGLDGALARLAYASYGPYLLGLVAVGLVCFGAWSMVEARYREMTG